MNDDSGSLGFKLISVSIALTTVAAIFVGVVVTKMSEDTTRERLYRDVEQLYQAAAKSEAEDGPDPAKMSLALLDVKLKGAGSGWIIDGEGRLVAGSDPRIAPGDTGLGDTEIELTSVSQPLAQIGEKTVGKKIPIKQIVGLYRSGFGIITLDKYTGENKVVAFRSVPEKGWLVGADEPLAEAASATSNLKRYVLITCVVLGIGIIVSVAISISFIIKPFYRSQMELSQKISAANRNLKKLHEVSIGMQKHLDLDQRIGDILFAAREVVGLDRIFIFMPDAETQYLQCRGAVGNEDEPASELRIPVGSAGGAIARVFMTRETIRITQGNIPESLRLSPPYSELKALRSREFVVIPLIVEDACVGVVAADNQLSKIPISKEKIAGIELFINQAAVAIQNSNMYEKLRVHADYLEITDHLTSTFTFDHFKRLLSEIIEESKKEVRTFSLGIITVGNFGTYNRLSGHKNGDGVLSMMAKTIKAKVGDDGVVGRCFGSTFGVIIPDMSEKEAKVLLRSVVDDLSRISFPHQELLDEGGLSFLFAVLPYRKEVFQTGEEMMSLTIERARGINA